MQSPRTVVDNLLRKRPAERVGLHEGPWAETIARWVREGYPTRPVRKEVGEDRWRPEDGRTEKVAVAGEYAEPVPSWEHFGFDMIGGGGGFDFQPLRGVSELLEESDEWTIKRNGAGAALKYWKNKSGTPEHIDFRMTGRQVWDRDYRPHLLDLDLQRFGDLAKVKQAFLDARASDRWVYFGHMFMWEIMRQSLGDLTLYESLLLDPDWIRDIGRVYTDFYKRHYTWLFENIGVPDGMWMFEDLGYRNGLFASPKVLSDLIFPFFHEMVEFFHARNLPVILHSCGSQADALPLIVEAGFDGLNPMERKADKNDPFAFAEKYGDRLAFIGGLDVRVFETNDKATIRREITDYIDGMKARGARLVFASDHSMPLTVSYESYRYAVEVYRERMMY